MWLSKAIHVDGTSQFDTNTCHHNKKLDQILNHLHLFWDFPKSPIKEYSDGWRSNPVFLRKKEVWHSKVHIRTSCHYKKPNPFQLFVITCPLQFMARKCINKFIWLPIGGFWLRIWENWQPKWFICTFCHEWTSYLLVCTLVPGVHKTTWAAEKCHG
jgi:hypothetical protein